MIYIERKLELSSSLSVQKDSNHDIGLTPCSPDFGHLRRDLIQAGIIRR